MPNVEQKSFFYQSLGIYNYFGGNMRLILSFMIFTVFGFAQQSCQKQTAATKTEKAKNNGGAVAANVANSPSPTVRAEAPADDAARISLEEAKKAFDAGDAVFVDTRAASAYQDEHIKGAINIPAGEFETRYKEVPKDKKVIAYCS